MIEEAWSKTIELIQEIEKNNQDVSKRIAKDITELIAVGEYQIALENMVSNVCEYDIELDKDAINLTREAFCIWKNYEYLRLLRNIRIKQ